LELGEDLIRFVADRPGHDLRYSVDCGKLRALGWRPRVPIVEGLAATVAWYRDNRPWWEKIKSGEWRRYYEVQYRELHEAGSEADADR
jgi:dTDP-glucose 4,6-dehydratase